MDREIPEEDAARLRTLTGLTDFPPKLVTKYWELARLATRQNDAVRDYDLRWLCFQLGHGKAFDRELNPSVVDLYRKRQIAHNARVSVRHGKAQKGGVFKGLGTQNLVRVLLDGDGEVREYKAADVKVVELAVA